MHARQSKSLNYSVTFTNIRSVMTKRDDLSAFICDNNSSIVILTESWLKPEINDSEIFPDELQFDVYRCDRISKRGGGVLIAIKKMCLLILCSSLS